MADLALPPNDDFYAYRPATVECVIQAATKQGVSANILLAIASIEGGKNGQMVCSNDNGTCDLSHFQINTETFRLELEPYGVKMDDVRWRGCYNAELGAFLLKKRLNEPPKRDKATGQLVVQDFWTKAANYHSRTPKFNTIYKAKLIAL
jgi:hypothetical protein